VWFTHLPDSPEATMTISLHTGVRTATVHTEWTAWDTPFRLVVTDPWAMHKARRMVADLMGVLAANIDPRLPVMQRDALLADMFGAGARTARLRPFPYGIAAVPDGAEVHRSAPAPWQQVFAAVSRERTGWRVQPGPSAASLIAQRCAELVAEATCCGVLVAFGGQVATSGLAPVGGWRVELREAPGEPSTSVAVDGGAISTVSTVRPGRGGRPDWLQPFLAPASGRPVVPGWRSIAVAAADAPSASAACAAALLLGGGAPGWLAERGLPARLVDAGGAVHPVGHWPVAA
jgi:FAD:protein FMN transferase